MFKVTKEGPAGAGTLNDIWPRGNLVLFGASIQPQMSFHSKGRERPREHYCERESISRSKSSYVVVGRGFWRPGERAKERLPRCSSVGDNERVVGWSGWAAQHYFVVSQRRLPHLLTWPSNAAPSEALIPKSEIALQ